MEYVKARRLIAGKSTVGLVAPSGIIVKHELEAGMAILRSWGFSIKLGRHITAKRGDYSAGTEEQRARDLTEMIKDEEVSAIGCIEGGFAIAGVIKKLEPEIFDKLRKKPKIFFGYSDFSLILNILFSKGLISLHAPNVAGLSQRSLDSQKCLQLSLVGDTPAEIGPLFDWEPIEPGFTKGRLLVSNLENLMDLLGTPFDPLKNGDDPLILALEEVGGNKSTIARWLEKLMIHSESERIKGIIIGRFTKVGEVDYPIWGKEMSLKRIFLKVFGKKGVPIASLPEFGHIEERKKGFLRPRKPAGREKIDFLSLPTGIEVQYKVKAQSCRLTFLEKPFI